MRTASHVCLLILACLSGPAATSAPGVCHAPIETPPCAAASGLAPAGEPGLDLGISNPIHLGTGEKFLRETDLPARPDGAFPPFVRFYRSSGNRRSPLGAGWASLYDVRLRHLAAGWQIDFPEGPTLRFDRQGRGRTAASGTLHALSASPAASQHKHAPAGNAAPGQPIHATWVGPEGQRLSFDASGRLRHLRRPGSPDVHLDYPVDGPFAGYPRQIRSRSASLTLHYHRVDGHVVLQAMDSPLGRFAYVHEPAAGNRPHPPRLTAVQRPDGMRRHYHYEPAHQGKQADALTGVSVGTRSGATWRVRAWAYDAQGRVIRAAPGEFAQSDRSALTLSYHPSGQAASTARTRIRTSTGHLDVSHTNGPSGTRITRLDRVDCDHCPRRTLSARHDAAGRLVALGDLRLTRDPQGQLRALTQTEGGWPGLRLNYSAQGLRTAWASTLTGETRLDFDADRRLIARRHANGDRTEIRRDAAGRPRQLHATSPRSPPDTTTLQWRGPLLQQLTHDHEVEQQTLDDAGRLLRHRVSRPHPQGAVRYEETFQYDPQGRLIRHRLPEGGALHYAWGPGTRLRAIVWESPAGTRHPVIHATSGIAGYRYGNGLALQVRADARGRAETLVLSHAGQVLWAESRPQDDRGRIRRLTQFMPTLNRMAQHDFAYDAQNRLRGVLTRQGPAGPTHSANAPETTRRHGFDWHPDGSLRRRTDPDHAPAPPPDSLPLAPISRDAAGLPLQMGAYGLHYGANQRLAEVRHATGTVRYTHNGRGHTIRRQQGNQETERYYLDNRLVGLWHRPAGPSARPDATKAVFGISQRYIYAHDVPVGLLQTSDEGRTTLFYLHADLRGAAVLATDAARRVRWAAAYDVLGRAAHRFKDGLDVPLRLPGQDEDPTTGWHDNVFRTYLPKRGHYLEPDPIGPLPGQQSLGYAAQQPMRHIDPLGLVLFSFDGTRYAHANQSNVWKLSQAYADGETFYHAGPGNNAYIDWDAITAASSGQILRNQWQSLLNTLQQAQGSPNPTPIDILGYSRGAALARDFANRIAGQTRGGWFAYDDPLRGTIGLCLNLRFLGLFDTVAQFGLLGAANAGYDLSIPGAWQWVAHAVALHEFRGTFPLMSALAGTPANAVEAPFIGAHADIGGGMLLDDQGRPEPGGDLSDVALNWMYGQALAALVPLDALEARDRQVTQPWLHDERLPMYRILENSDRSIQDPQGGSLGLQRHDPQLGEDTRRAMEAFIHRVDRWQTAAGNRVGEVDMAGYGAWLETQLGLPGMRP